MRAVRPLRFLTVALAVTAGLVASIGLTPLAAASPVKGGAACASLGKVQVSQGREFRCTRKGGKLVWVRGRVGSRPKPPTPSTPATPTATPSPAPFTQTSAGVSMGICRLTSTNQFQTGYSFPRSTSRLPGQGEIRGVMLFVEFQDSKSSEDIQTVADRYRKDFIRFYSAMSYGRVTFRIDAPNRFFQIPKPVDSYDMNMIRGITNPRVDVYFRDALDAADPFVDFSSYDVVYVIPPEKNGAITYGPAFPMPPGNSLLQTNEKVILNGAVAGADSRDRTNSLEWVWMAHETGHLFGVEHPWRIVAGPQGQTSSESKFAIWSLMLNMGWRNRSQPHEFLAWERFLMDWIDESNGICLDSTAGAWRQESHRLRLLPISSQESGVKAAFIKESPTTAIVLEFRTNGGFDKFPEEFEGLLVYRMDVARGYNQGNAELLQRGPVVTENMTVGTIKPGEIIQSEAMEIRFIARHGGMAYVEVVGR